MSDDHYLLGHADSVLRSHRWRTAANSAAYLLPYLGEQARILDVGCGPGTITLDFARLAGSGFVVGLDRSEAVVSEAAAAAGEAGIANVQFAVGDAYALDYAADTFDVVHAHQVLQHLTDPIRALREMARVCKPVGVIGVRDADYAAFTWWPTLPELDEWLALYRRLARSSGAEPDAGRRLKSWAQAAGLTVHASTASAWCFASDADVTWWGELWAERVAGTEMSEQAKARGLATDADLGRIAQGWRRWSIAADAWFAVVHGELICSGGAASPAPDPT